MTEYEKFQETMRKIRSLNQSKKVNPLDIFNEIFKLS